MEKQEKRIFSSARGCSVDLNKQALWLVLDDNSSAFDNLLHKLDLVTLQQRTQRLL